jgi:hypothetical protein
VLLGELGQNVVVAIEVIILVARVAVKHQDHGQLRLAVPLERRV